MTITLSLWDKAPFVFFDENPPEEVRETIDQDLSYEVDGFRWSDSYKDGSWDGRHHLLREASNGNLHFPVGVLDRVTRVLDMYGLDYEVENLVRPGRGDLDVEWNGPELRHYQTEAVNEALRRGSGVVAMPTGTGKTHVGLRLIYELQRPAIVTCDQQEIADQWVDRIEDVLGIDPAICYGGARENGDVQVALYQSVYDDDDGEVRSDVRLDHDVFVADECLAGDSLVAMADGSGKPIRDVEVGDWVLSVSDSGGVEPAPVTDKWDQGVRDVVDVDGLVCTPDHEFYTDSGMVEASSIGTTNVFALQKRTIGDVRLPEMRVGSTGGEDCGPRTSGGRPLWLCHPSKINPSKGNLWRLPMRCLWERVHGAGFDVPAQTPGPRFGSGVGLYGGWVRENIRYGSGVGRPRGCCSWSSARDAIHIGEDERLLGRQVRKGTAGDNQREVGWISGDGRTREVEGGFTSTDCEEDVGAGPWGICQEYGVRDLWPRGCRGYWEGVVGPSQRWKRWEQRPVKPRCTVLQVSQEGSQQSGSRLDEYNQGGNPGGSHGCALGVVEAGEAEPAGRRRVYDIEVAENHNFFADGMLVSNCHNVGAQTFSQCALSITAPYRFGLSATPEREDNATLRVLGGTGPLIVDYDVQDMIDEGWLAEPEWHILDAPHSGGRYRQWQDEYAGEIVENGGRNQMIADIVEELETPCYIHVERINHGERLESLIPEAQFISAESSDRDEAIQAFRDGELPVLISTLLGEGFDLPSMASLVMAGGLKTEVGAIQKVGRALRPDTETAAIVDFADRGEYVGDHSEQRFRTYQRYYKKHGP